MAGHDAFDRKRLERMERRLRELEDAEAIRNLSRATQPCATTIPPICLTRRSSASCAGADPEGRR